MVEDSFDDFSELLFGPESVTCVETAKACQYSKTCSDTVTY